MTIWKMSADQLVSSVMGDRANTVTLNNLTFDPVTRVVTLEIVGAEVPDVPEVELDVHFITHKWFLKPKTS